MTDRACPDIAHYNYTLRFRSCGLSRGAGRDVYKRQGATLLPFISEQKYNQAIKEAFRLAGLDRVVTVLNPLTRNPEQKYLYEVVTTHTARKTFIGNMYKKAKDPDLVSSVSGHKEGWFLLASMKKRPPNRKPKKRQVHRGMKLHGKQNGAKAKERIGIK